MPGSTKSKRKIIELVSFMIASGSWLGSALLVELGRFITIRTLILVWVSIPMPFGRFPC